MGSLIGSSEGSTQSRGTRAMRERAWHEWNTYSSVQNSVVCMVASMLPCIQAPIIPGKDGTLAWSNGGALPTVAIDMIACKPGNIAC